MIGDLLGGRGREWNWENHLEALKDSPDSSHFFDVIGPVELPRLHKRTGFEVRLEEGLDRLGAASVFRVRRRTLQLTVIPPGGRAACRAANWWSSVGVPRVL